MEGDEERRQCGVLDNAFEETLCYRDLQQIAISMNLPANHEWSTLLALVKARRRGDDRTVEDILTHAPRPKRRATASAAAASASAASEAAVPPNASSVE
ncbi:Protein of unknown function, partial [Gryllus bimaculatus]